MKNSWLVFIFLWMTMVGCGNDLPGFAPVTILHPDSVQSMLEAPFPLVSASTVSCNAPVSQVLAISPTKGIFSASMPATITNPTGFPTAYGSGDTVFNFTNSSTQLSVPVSADWVFAFFGGFSSGTSGCEGTSANPFYIAYGATETANIREGGGSLIIFSKTFTTASAAHPTGVISPMVTLTLTWSIPTGKTACSTDSLNLKIALPDISGTLLTSTQGIETDFFVVAPMATNGSSMSGTPIGPLPPNVTLAFTFLTTGGSVINQSSYATTAAATQEVNLGDFVDFFGTQATCY